MIADPPLFNGAVHQRLICDDDITAALSPVGAPGTVDDVVADEAVDTEPIPTEFIADTL